MAPNPLEIKTSEVSGEAEKPAPTENGASGFSDDDVDTEIEVTPEENSEKKPRKKKKKSDENNKEGKKEKQETPEEREERKKRKKERKLAREAKKKEVEDVDPPPYSPPLDDDKEAAKKPKQGKKQKLKSQFSDLMDAPLRFAFGILVCVILPFSIYACDVILSVNVIDRESYKGAIISPINNMSQLPMPELLVGQKYHIQRTIFMSIQINSKPKTRYTRAVGDEPNIVDAAVDPSVTPATSVSTESTTTTTKKVVAPPSTTSEKTPLDVTSSMTSSTTTTTAKSTTTTTLKPVLVANSTILSTNDTILATQEPQNTTIRRKPAKFIPRPGFRFTTLKTTTTEKANATPIDPDIWKRQDGEFCKGLYYFYDLHMSYAHEYGSDWFEDESYSAYQKEQTLFFMFTIIGFISLLIGLGLRCDVFLTEEWSSFILVNLFLYSISMAVTVAVFAQESSEGGLRCATCRFTTYCSDIDPWNYHTHWPAEPDTIQWSMVALISFIFKLIDCYAIGIVTLKFILDLANDLWWITCLKLFGWLIMFPLLIFTPMLGVTRYLALPGVSPNDDAAMLAVEILFYIGVAFWALCLLALPFFCKMRMCSGSDEDEAQEEEDEYDY
ncbi:uncharacterized protein LOC120342382 [Styela clava]